MKVVHLCLTTPFDSTLAYQDNLLPKYQRKAGHEVTVVTTCYLRRDALDRDWVKAPLKEEMTAEGVKVLRLAPWLPFRINRRFHLYRGLRKVLEQERPDLLFVHGLASVSYLALLPFHRRHPSVHILFDNHGDRLNSCRSRLAYFYTRYIYRWLVSSRLARIGERFYGVTPARCDFLREIYGVPENKIDLLLMGADDEAVIAARDGGWRDRIRTEYAISPEDVLVVTGGKIDRQKNIHNLVKAVAESKFKNLKILVFGAISAEMKPLFDALEGDRVFFVGWVPSEQVYRYFYAADLVMFPGLHSVLWEQALACRVPCGFNRLDGFGHVEVAGTFRLVGNSVESYRKKLEELLSDPEGLHSLKTAADSSERDNFLYSRIAGKVLRDVAGYDSLHKDVRDEETNTCHLKL
ncbi:MAG: glycosyltransferase family 4 protein [Bacteroidales bacterium]|nr:glycosyltransferase family 4 protein [Bacteroidales bacterium]